MRRGMNSMEMQKNNRILVFKTLQEKGMMTRAELAVELNLQKATITNIINEFFEMGIVEVNGETAAGRRGEKLNLKLDDIYTMSIGITRKDYQLAIFDLSGNMIKHSCCNFQKENGYVGKVPRGLLAFRAGCPSAFRFPCVRLAWQTA